MARLSQWISLFTCMLLLGSWTGLSVQPAGTGSLHDQLDGLFADTRIAAAWCGVQVSSLDQETLIYERNPQRYFVPASNLKLFTAAAALRKLGADFRYRTDLYGYGEIEEGHLTGSLLVVGSGDPSLGARLSSPDLEDPSKGDARAVFRTWALRLRELGIHQVDGDLIGDARIFDPEGLATGWAWDDLPLGYAAETAGLQYNENVVLAILSPSGRSGDAVQLELAPETSYIQIENQVVTGPPGSEMELEVRRNPGSNDFRLRGVIPTGWPPVKRTLAVYDPTAYFLTALRESLQENGIRVLGDVVQVTQLESEVSRSKRLLFSYESPPLSELLRIFLKSSQNLYGESIIRSLAPSPQGKSLEAGLEEATRQLEQLGISPDSYQMVDGSGLSRYNLVTPQSLVELLSYLYRSSYRELVLDLLPEAGSDGTLKHRLVHTTHSNRVVAKTGTLSNIRALSGYLLREDGETLVFSILINHFLHPTADPEWFQDRFLEILAASPLLLPELPAGEESGAAASEP